MTHNYYMSQILKIHIENLKPVSTNQMYDGHLKSVKYLKQERVIDAIMLKYRKAIERLMEIYDEHKHLIHVTMIIHSPKESLFNKSGKRKGCISKRCLDIDNSIKTVTDSIFYNIPTIDDSQVRRFVIDEILSKDDFFHITYYIEIKDKTKHYDRTVTQIENRLFP